MNWNDLLVATQLSFVPKMGPARLNKLMDYLESTDTPFQLLGEYETTDLVADAGFTDAQASAFTDSRDAARRLAESLEEMNVVLITRKDEAWPDKQNSSASREGPPWIFVSGNASLLAAESMGVGGSRDASELALKAAANFTREMSNRGQVIVSGGARGVDTSAHDAAIGARGRTVVVLSQGILNWVLPEPWATASHEGRLAVISEFPPGAPWGSFRAMQRNSTVLWLSNAFFIAQSGTRGGTFEAGLTSLELSKPTFVAQYLGDPTNNYAGNQVLISRGAVPLSFSSDSAELLNPDDYSLISSIGRPHVDQLPLF